MKNHLFFFFYVFLSPYSFGQAVRLPDPGYSFVQGKSFVQSKNYYLLTLFEEIEAAKSIIQEDQKLNILAASKLAP